MTHDNKLVLIVDDTPTNVGVISGVLKGAYRTKVATNGEKALVLATAAEKPDLILLDVMMPGMDGYDVCKRLKSDPLTSRIPIILLTAKSNYEDRLEGLEAYADDYITKPWEQPELLLRVRNQLKTRRAQLQSNALTGLPGNVLIETELNGRISAREKFAFLHLDLDYFKSFNDYYGYARGDALIRFTASLLHEVLEQQGGERDFVGHIGGDDFVIITVPDRSLTVAETIRAEFDRRVIEQYDAADRERGYITVHSSRQGGVQNFELLSITILIVTNAQRDIQHSAQVADVAKELKKIGKATKGSCVIPDRRTDGTPTVPTRTPGSESVEP
jgi:diguanylate cyclase (GGDEF)-like protein